MCGIEAGLVTTQSMVLDERMYFTLIKSYCHVCETRMSFTIPFCSQQILSNAFGYFSASKAFSFCSNKTGLSAGSV